MGLLHPEILNLQVLSDLKISGKTVFQDLLLNFINGSKQGVEEWIKDNQEMNDFGKIFKDF